MSHKQYKNIANAPAKIPELWPYHSRLGSTTLVMANTRVRVDGSAVGRKGKLQSEEGERAIVMEYLHRILGVVGVKAQGLLLFGRVDRQGPGAAAAHHRQKKTASL